MLHASISRSDNTFSGKDLQTAQVALRKNELINILFFCYSSRILFVRCDGEQKTVLNRYFLINLKLKQTR